MVTIYNDYGDEPEDRFIPLPARLGCTFYDLEMDAYNEDILFFDQLLPARGQILELGCGSGRFARSLSSEKRPFTGVDISLPMLQRAQRHWVSSGKLVCMDMTNLCFSCRFDAIIIPYNTLNLLVERTKIQRCLDSCREYLASNGQLLLHLYTPTKKLSNEGKKTFQFQIFDLPSGGRLIKEILKEFDQETLSIHVEERFRYRPTDPGSSHADYNSCYSIAAPSSEQWFELLSISGFEVVADFEDFDGTPAGSGDRSTLLLACKSFKND